MSPPFTVAGVGLQRKKAVRGGALKDVGGKEGGLFREYGKDVLLS